MSFLNEDGGLSVFFPNNSFVTNSTLTKTTKLERPPGGQSLERRPVGGNDHIACYGGDPTAAQVTWHNSNGPLVVCQRGTTPVPCQVCGNVCVRNGAVALDPQQQGHTDIHLFTTISAYVNQDLQCRVNGGQSAFIGVYISGGGE